MNPFDVAAISDAPAKKSGSSDVYWATEEPEKLVSYLDARRTDFWNFLVTSDLYDRIARNWEYYHNIYYTTGNETGKAIKAGGDEGDLALVSLNHFRSVIHSIITYVTKDKPAWDTRAVNSDDDALQAAELGNNILQFYMEDKGVEEYLRRAVEDALIFTAGYVKVEWDEDLGEEANPAYGPTVDALGRPMHEGDLKYSNPNMADVVYDFACSRRFEDSRWTYTREPANKWELIDLHPEYREEILAAEAYQSDDGRYQRIGPRGANTDMVELWTFYHEKTQLLPFGRYVKVVGKQWLTDEPLPDWCKGKKPIYRIVPAPFLGTSFGYTPAFDLQSVQEAINSEASTIITNHKNLGPTKIWKRYGEPINLATLEPGCTVLETETEPKAINFAQTPREFFQFLDALVKHIEYLSGINAVARGAPEANLRSAAAVEFVEQKAVQYNAPLTAAYYKLLSDIGTATLNILKVKADSPRVIYVAGINNKTQWKSFEKTKLSPVNCVSVIPGNAATQTPAGKAQMATELLQNGQVTGEEYITVRKTGQIRPLTESADAQLSKVHKENEILRQGGRVEADILDNQVFHIRKHQSVIDDPNTDPMSLMATKAHIQGHLEILLSVAGQVMQRALGYEIPMPPMYAQIPQEGGQPPAGPPTRMPGPQQNAPKMSAGPGNEGDFSAEQPGVGGNEPGGIAA